MNSEKLDVIAVGAHPDDCEIGCGATLALLAQDGFRVGIVDLTDGEPTPLCDTPAVRLEEARLAAEVLGVCKRITLELPNRRLFDSFEARVELARVFRIHKPSLVIGMIGKTPTASPDHWQAMQIIDGAIFYSRLSKWDHHFEGLEVHPIKHQLYYTLNLVGNYQEPGMNPFVVDVSKSLEKKLKAVRCYQTQFPPAKQGIFQRLESLARLAGLSADFEAGEVMYSPKMIGLKNLNHFAS